MGSVPVAIEYHQREAGDQIFVITRERIPIPDGWTDLSWNQDTNPNIFARRVMCAGDGDVWKEWNIEHGNTAKARVMVFRNAPPAPPPESGGLTSTAAERMGVTWTMN
jgi:hypothetical protein